MKILLLTFVIVGIIALPFIFNNCSGFSSANNSGSATTSPGSLGFPSNAIAIPFSSPLPIAGTESNVLPVTVGCGYVNEPCASVTICSPGASLGSNSCVTVNNLLLDTGSYGLRIFSDLIPSSLTLASETDSASGQALAECVGYADGTSDWGPVATADVYLGNGNEKAANLPIQIINANYPGIPSNCSNPDTYSLASGNASNVGYNGILGVGLFGSDCGSGCVSDSANQIYFACSGSTCNGATAPVNMQVSNPVSSLASDNNGVILQLPNVSSSGATSLSGFLILGIGTQTDNMPAAGVSMFQADQNGNFDTYYAGQLYSDATTNAGAFIDSGSNALNFPDSTIPQCSISTGFYCPASLNNLIADQSGTNSSPQDLVPFQVGNADSELSESNPNIVFNNLAGTAVGTFDWGFPFFLGKSVYVGIDGTQSALGTGPYWGF